MVKKIAILTSKLPECAHGKHNYAVTFQEGTTQSSCYEVVQLHTCMCNGLDQALFPFFRVPRSQARMLDPDGPWWPSTVCFTLHTSITHLVYHQAFCLDFLAPQYQQETSACAWGVGSSDHSLAAAILEETWSPVTKNSDSIMLHDSYLHQTEVLHIVGTQQQHICYALTDMSWFESAMDHSFPAGVETNTHVQCLVS